MNKVQKAIRDKIVAPEMKKQINDMIGIVSHSNYEEGVCDVEITNPTSGAEITLKDTPICMDNQEGIIGQFLKVGDYVMLTFPDNKISNGKVIKKHIKNHKQNIESKYQSEKGVYTSDAYGYF